MIALVSAFQSLIPPKFVLEKQGGFWVVEEPGAGNCRLEIAGGKSQAFSLDRGGVDVFPFFSGTLAGMKSVNDALVVAVVGAEAYVMAVEMKTSPARVTDALRQIECGRQFLLWARGLLSLHGHWQGGPCRFFGVVSLKPRKQVRKRATVRSGELPAPSWSYGGNRYPFFVLENHPRVSVTDLIKKLNDTLGPCPVVA